MEYFAGRYFSVFDDVYGGTVPAADPIVLAPGETTIVRVYYPNQKTGNKAIISFEPQLLETNDDKGYHVMKVTQEDIDRLTAAGLRVKPDDSWTSTQPEALDGESEETDDEGIPGYPCYRTVEETFATAEQITKNIKNLPDGKMSATRGKKLPTSEGLTWVCSY